jgi:predicted dehydrogenase
VTPPTEDPGSGIRFAYEVEQPLRVAFLGTSGHAFRNFLPSLAYAAVDLVALWDPDRKRAESFARQFGAGRAYTDLDALLREVAPDAVLIGADGYADDEPLNALLMARCLEAGCHVWTDKPVAATVAGVENLIGLRDKAARVAAVGAKTMYNPAHLKARQIVRGPAFGRPTSFSSRYPLHLPGGPGRPLTDQDVRSCLSHIWHPVGAALAIVGPIESVTCLPGPAGSGGVATATFADGTVGAFHFSAGQAATSPLERVEVVGEGSNIVIENGARLTWFRRADVGPYGRTPSYITADESAPLRWEPEMSLGQLYNNNNFLQGYAPSIIAFVEAALGLEPLELGTLEDALTILRFFDAVAAPSASSQE